MAIVESIDKIFLKLDEISGKLNGGGGLVVHVDQDSYVLDKTWQEIHDALAAGSGAVLVYNDTDCNPVISCYYDPFNETYNVDSRNIGNSATYSTGSASGYPQFAENNSGGGLI